MTTAEPNPTAAEHEKADQKAEALVTFGPDDGVPESRVNLARCYLALKAQLAESERAREALRAAAREAQVRVLDRIISQEKDLGRFEAIGSFMALKRRIEQGEDL